MTSCQPASLASMSPLPAPCCSEYPGLPEGVKPLDRLVENTNELGQLLSEGQQEALMQVRGGQPAALQAGEALHRLCTRVVLCLALSA